MKRKIALALLVSLFIGGSFSLTKAQNAPLKSPYVNGEVLYYEGKLSKLVLRGISVAELKFSVSAAPDGENHLVKTDAVSKGTLLKLFRFSFVQNYESTVDAKNLTVLKTVKLDRQKERVRNSEAKFDYEAKKVNYVETDPNDASRAPRTVVSSINKETYDLTSAIYLLRALPLAVNKNFVLDVSDSGLVYQVPARVTARETQNTIFGKTPCFRVEPQIFGPGRMIESEGSIIIWISDDARRLPVRAQLNTNLGRLEIRLRQVEMKKT